MFLLPLQLHPVASECLSVSAAAVFHRRASLSVADVTVPPAGPNFTPPLPLYLGGVEHLIMFCHSV